MTTATLQFLASLLAVGFALTAWRVARHPGVSAPGHRAWIIVAMAFLWRAVPEAVQTLLAFWALHAGPGAQVYEMFVRWTPAVNHGRTLIAVALAWVLAALPLVRDQPARRVWAGAALTAPAFAAVGLYVGWREGATSAAHLASLSVLGTLELVGLLAALQIALWVPTLDRHLWSFFCAYAVHVAVKIVWYYGAIGFFLGQDWYPPAWALPLLAIPVYLAGIVLARRRLALAQRGARIPGPFEGVGGGLLSAPPARGEIRGG
jgi:hypothetical protein